MTASTTAKDLAREAAIAADQKGAEDLVAIDVTEKLPLTDAFLIASGRNERQVNSIVDAIEDALLEKGVKALRREGRTEGRWALLDFGDLIVHVFHEEDRLYYSLERLWNDCPVIPLELPTSATGEPAG